MKVIVEENGLEYKGKKGMKNGVYCLYLGF